jgi:hypothetical protein
MGRELSTDGARQRVDGAAGGGALKPAEDEAKGEGMRVPFGRMMNNTRNTRKGEGGLEKTRQRGGGSPPTLG